MVAVLAEQILGNPCDRASITISGLGVGASTATLWRVADGERNPVRGARRVVMTDASYVVDWDAPLGRPISYELEVLSGPAGASRTRSNTCTIEAATGWLLDPLLPQTAVPVIGGDGDSGPYLRAKALSALEYAADISIFNIMGTDKPLALFGQRQAARGVDTSLGTESAEQNARLAKLFKSTAQLLFKPLPEWGNFELPGTLFLANAKATQVPVDVSWGGAVTWWDLTSDVVGAPAIRVLTATFTYGDVELLMSTYQQKQDLMGGKTYLDDLKNPIGG